jgi:hypothetical protein
VETNLDGTILRRKEVPETIIGLTELNAIPINGDGIDIKNCAPDIGNRDDSGRRFSYGVTSEIEGRGRNGQLARCLDMAIPEESKKGEEDGR